MALSYEYFKNANEALTWLENRGFPWYPNEMPEPDYSTYPIGTIWNYSCCDYDGSRLLASIYLGSELVRVRIQSRG